MGYMVYKGYEIQYFKTANMVVINDWGYPIKEFHNTNNFDEAKAYIDQMGE